MKTALLLTLCPVLLLACGGETPTPGPAPTPAALEIDDGALSDALAQAAVTGKNVVLEYSSKSCKFCTQMDTEVFADPEVVEALAKVIYLRLEQDDNGAPFEARFGRLGTPTYVVLKADGSQVGKLLTGFIDVGDFLTWLDWATGLEGDEPEIKTGGS